MKHALIVIPSPVPDNQRESPYDHWRALLNKLTTSVSKAEGVLCISPNVFVVPFDKNVAFLGELIQSSKDRKLAFQMLLLDEAPEWVHYTPAA